MKVSRILVSVAIASIAVAHPLDVVKRYINTTELEDDIPDSSKGDAQTAYGKPFAIYQPKAFIVSMFEYEREPWLDALDFAHNISIPGLSPLYPDIYCTTNYTVCQVTTGEGDINAAATLSALTLNPLFDLTKTYWLIAGIAGGEPNYTTLGSVAFAKYAIQVGLEYQIDYTEYHKTNPNWTTGYFAYGTDNPWTYPGNVYGTEVFELNESLRNRAFELAQKATLNNGTQTNAKFRAKYTEKKAKSFPSVEKCDSLTSDNYFTGKVLNDYFSKFSSMMTNGSSKYCTTAQEDNASLEVFTRSQKHGLVDFDRIVLMRSVSDFSRPPPSLANDTVKFFTKTNEGGSIAAVENLVNAGFPFIRDVVQKWDKIYSSGKRFPSKNYVGDIYGTLGGIPDFGKESFEEA
ncbi:uncharacterized protein PRCAT00003345001 [Priceomyces carsonii]|uniref:uncharacterized protein n=1 Tax=Priceomyces carsonii TaxID=28549 RepID=UPI002EDA8A56|nr:unnamed protein product [Priceomyces carsonii]